MRESIEDKVNEYFVQNMISSKGAHKICEYPDCVYQTLKPDNCNIVGCKNKLHHMCQQDHDIKYWKGGLEDKVDMIKVCYTCAGHVPGLGGSKTKNFEPKRILIIQF